MIPMTSIASESAFSTGGRVLNDTRNCLKPETLEALIICGQDWIATNEGLHISNTDAIGYGESDGEDEETAS
jgi:hypothetical protein